MSNNWQRLAFLEASYINEYKPIINIGLQKSVEIRP